MNYAEAIVTLVNNEGRSRFQGWFEQQGLLTGPMKEGFACHR